MISRSFPPGAIHVMKISPTNIISRRVGPVETKTAIATETGWGRRGLGRWARLRAAWRGDPGSPRRRMCAQSIHFSISHLSIHEVALIVAGVAAVLLAWVRWNSHPPAI